MKRLLTENEKNLINRVIQFDDDFLDTFQIYINQNWIKYTFISYWCNYIPSSIYGLTSCNNIYLSFDPNFNNRNHMEILIHEFVHIYQCLHSCCLSISLRYICECFRYGPIGMYRQQGTLEEEATYKARIGILEKGFI